ncbi:MAG: hypothetical protein IJ466_02760 [Clostridia bacterium]|nr:hypothetical protein [Clostridia bacterium]
METPEKINNRSTRVGKNDPGVVFSATGLRRCNPAGKVAPGAKPLRPPPLSFHKKPIFAAYNGGFFHSRREIMKLDDYDY